MKKVIIIAELKGGTKIAGYLATHMGNFRNHAERIDFKGKIVESTTPPAGIIEGRLWLDISDNTSQDTVLSGILNSVSTLTQSVGNLTQLTTTNKTSLVQAINETKQYANDGKTRIGNVIGIPTDETFPQMESHIQWRKDRLAENLRNKAVSAAGTEKLVDLIDKVAQISTGRKWSSGTLPWQIGYEGAALQTLTISNLPFRPSVIIIMNHLYYKYYTEYWLGGQWVPDSTRTADNRYIHLHWDEHRFETNSGGTYHPKRGLSQPELQVTNNGFSFIYNVYYLSSNAAIDDFNNCYVQWVAYE